MKLILTALTHALLLCAGLLAIERTYAQATIWGMNSYGPSADGTIFSMKADGSSLQTRHSFLADPINPGLPNGGYFSNSWLEYGQLVQYNGKLYGTRLNGGPNAGFNGNNGGVLFQYDPATGQDSTLYLFSAPVGCHPMGGLTIVNGTLWGMTAYGGNTSLSNGQGYGVIFSFDLTTGQFTTVYKFSGVPDGGRPTGTLIFNPSDALLYGMTSTGGPTSTSYNGTLFSIDPAAGASSLQVRANYGGNGGLTLMNNKLYGLSGPLGTGTGSIFSYDPATTVYTKLYALGASAVNTLTVYNGLLYGLTYNGGTYGGGNIYSFDPAAGTYTDLFDMRNSASDPNGGTPYGTLTVYNNMLWGACSSGGIQDNNDGEGVLFSYDPAGKIYTPVYQFGYHDYNFANWAYYEGYNCYGGVTLYNNKLYGIAGDQGVIGNNGTGGGTLFSWDPAAGALKNEVYFNINDYNGKAPKGHLYSYDHLLYGITSNGGLTGYGNMFSIDPVTNAYRMLTGFNPDSVGGSPSGNPVAFNGKLYGAVTMGGLAPTNGQGGAGGSIYEYDPATGKVNFPYILSTSTDGSSPQGPFVVYNGLLYGATQNGGANGSGTIFSYNPASKAYTVVFSFTSATTGGTPKALLISNGIFYGYTTSGGPNSNGLVFSFNPANSQFTDLLDLGTATVPLQSMMSLVMYKNVLYGATNQGGTAANGGLFSLDPGSKAYTDLYDFPGRSYVTDLVGYNGKILGTDYFGGSSAGVVFSIDPVSRAYAIVHSMASAEGSYPVGLMLLKSTPTISFPNISATYGQADAAPGATSTNPNPAKPVTYFVADPSIATVVNGKLHVLKAGTTTITAIQPEDDDYYADTVKATLTVAKAALTVSAQPASITYGNPIPTTFTAVYTGFAATDDATVLTGSPVFSTTATSSSVPGSYPINVDTSGMSAANYHFVIQPGQLTINPATPTIQFGTIPTTITYGDVPIDAGATSNSGAAPVYSSSNTAVATITGDNKIQLTGAGTVIITASFPATASYAAGSKDLTITVNPKALTLVVNNAYMQTGAALPSFTATFSGLVNGDQASVLTQAPQFATTASSSSPAGTYPITISNIGSLTAANYVVSSSYQQGTLTIGSIGFNGGDTRTYGAVPYDPGAVSGTGGTAVYTSSNPQVAVVNANNQVQIVGAGQTTITASFAASGSTPATSAQQTLTVEPAPLKIKAGDASRAYGQPNPTYSFSYAGFAYNDNAASLQALPQGGTPATVNSSPGTYPITPYGAASPNYIITNAAGTLTVTKAVQTIQFGALPTQATGNPDLTLTATASAGLTVTYTSSNPNVAIINGNTVHITGAGTTVITASQAGDVNYLPASDVQQTLTVNGLPSNIILPAIPTMVYGDPDFAVTATSSNTTAPVTYASSNPAVATIDANGLIHLAGAGVTTITATQAGSSTYSSGSSVPQTLNVNKVPLVVAVANQTLYQGQSPAPFVIGYSGFVNGDDTTAITTKAAGSTPVTANSPAGSYPIYIGGAVAANYSFNYVQGTITLLLGQPQQISFNTLPPESYGNPDFDAGASTTSGQPIVYISSDTTIATVVNGLIHLKGAGSVTITATRPGGNGYSAAAPIAQTMTVGKGQLVIRPDDVLLGAGQPLPVFTVTYTGFVNGDDSSSLTKLPVVTTTAAGHDAGFGQYAIIASGAVSRNYDISYQPGVLTVAGNGDQLNAFSSAPGVLTVSIFTNTVQKATVQLYSLGGQLVKEQQVQLFKDVNNFSLTTGNISPGVYIVKVWGEVSRLSQKIRIQ